MRLLLVAVAVGVSVTTTPAGGFTASQPSGLQRLLDLRAGIYSGDEVLGTIPRALPAYVAGFCGILLVAGLLGFYELGPTTIILLITAIGTIVYKFYWPR